jgi:hypothetical protein
MTPDEVHTAMEEAARTGRGVTVQLPSGATATIFRGGGEERERHADDEAAIEALRWMLAHEASRHASVSARQASLGWDLAAHQDGRRACIAMALALLL